MITSRALKKNQAARLIAFTLVFLITLTIANILLGRVLAPIHLAIAALVFLGLYFVISALGK